MFIVIPVTMTSDAGGGSFATVSSIMDVSFGVLFLTIILAVVLSYRRMGQIRRNQRHAVGD